MRVGNQDSLQRGLRHSRPAKYRELVASFLLETRTRFKEDCDTLCLFDLQHISPPLRWKPGLASKRIATILPSNMAYCEWWVQLETRTRFKEDCDPRPQAPPRARGTQNRWKPGLASKRIATVIVYLIVICSSFLLRLETRTRFKEDCDDAGFLIACFGGVLHGWKPGLASKRIATFPAYRRRGPSRMLETRTRFKEDCDCEKYSCKASARMFEVGNQDSLQRGLRPRCRRDVRCT